MRLYAVVLALLLIPAGVVFPSRIDQPGDSLVVHEWGTFTSVAGPDGRAINWSPLAGRYDLPCFVERTITNDKVRTFGCVRMETPVIYFYSPRELTVSARVGFPQGTITEWFPRTSWLGSQIAWNDVKVSPRLAPEFLTEPGSSHYYAARQTDATPLQVGGQTERFLFYRGVGRFGIPLSAVVGADNTVTLRNVGTGVIPQAILFENWRGRTSFRLLGPISEQLRIERPSTPGSPVELRQELEGILVSQGLFPKEAKAMVDTWEDSWLEEGARVFYIVPRAMVDSILPLDIRPAPAGIARVFVGRIELITPEVEQAVEQAVSSNDQAALARRGRFLQPIMTSLAAKQRPLHQTGVVQQVINNGINAWSRSRCQ